MQSMSKQPVESEKLTGFVVMPDGIESNFKQWWKSVPDDYSANVHYPHEKHGLQGRTSNNAKVQAKQAFLNFVDANSQPNGRIESRTQLTTSCRNLPL